MNSVLRWLWCRLRAALLSDDRKARLVPDFSIATRQCVKLWLHSGSDTCDGLSPTFLLCELGEHSAEPPPAMHESRTRLGQRMTSHRAPPRAPLRLSARGCRYGMVLLHSHIRPCRTHLSCAAPASTTWHVESVSAIITLTPFVTLPRLPPPSSDRRAVQRATCRAPAESWAIVQHSCAGFRCGCRPAVLSSTAFALWSGGAERAGHRTCALRQRAEFCPPGAMARRRG